MNAPDEHSRWAEMLPGYALGALGEDAGAFEAHLATCERCQAELNWLKPAVDVLPGAVEQREPPPRIRRELMKAVNAEAARAGAGARWRVGGWTLRRLRPALALGAIVAVLAAGLAGYALRGPEAEPAVAALEPTPTAPAGITGTLTAHDGATTLEVEGLPRLDRDVYQAWLRRGEDIEPASVFVPDRDGEATAALPVSLDEIDEVMVTREPPGGSRRPSSVPLLRAEPS